MGNAVQMRLRASDEASRPVVSCRPSGVRHPSRFFHYMIGLILFLAPMRWLMQQIFGDMVGSFIKEGFIVVLMALLFAKYAIRSETRACLASVMRTRPGKCVVLFLVSVTLCTLYQLGEDPLRAVVGFFEYATYPALMVIIVSSGFSAKQMRDLLGVVLITVPITAAVSLVAFAFQLEIGPAEFIYPLYTRTAAWRFSSLTGSSLHYGVFLALTLPVITSLLLDWVQRVRNVVWLTMGGIALVLTYSRGAWVQLILSLGVLLMLKRMSKWIWIGIPLLLAGFLFVPYLNRLGLTTLYLERLGSTLDWTVAADNVSRKTAWKVAFAMFTREPLLGVGLASTGNAVAKLTGTTPQFVTENHYLKVLLEGGLLVFFPFILLLTEILRVAYKLQAHQMPRLSRALSQGIFASLVGFAVELFVLQSLEAQVVAVIFWFYVSYLILETMRTFPPLAKPKDGTFAVGVVALRVRANSRTTSNLRPSKRD